MLYEDKYEDKFLYYKIKWKNMESELSDVDFFGETGESKSEEKSSRGGKMEDKEIFELVERKTEPLQKQVDSLKETNDKLQQELRAVQEDKEELKKTNEGLRQELDELKNTDEVSGKLNELQEKVNVCEENLKSHEHSVNWNPQELAQAITGDEKAVEILNQSFSNGPQEEQTTQESQEGQKQEEQKQEEEQVEQRETPFMTMEKLRELKAEQ